MSKRLRIKINILRKSLTKMYNVFKLYLSTESSEFFFFFLNHFSNVNVFSRFEYVEGPKFVLVISPCYFSGERDSTVSCLICFIDLSVRKVGKSNILMRMSISGQNHKLQKENKQRQEYCQEIKQNQIQIKTCFIRAGSICVDLHVRFASWSALISGINLQVIQ